MLRKSGRCGFDRRQVLLGGATTALVLGNRHQGPGAAGTEAAAVASGSAFRCQYRRQLRSRDLGKHRRSSILACGAPSTTISWRSERTISSRPNSPRALSRRRTPRPGPSSCAKASPSTVARRSTPTTWSPRSTIIAARAPNPRRRASSARSPRSGRTARTRWSSRWRAAAPISEPLHGLPPRHRPGEGWQGRLGSC